ncbi:unnamed protein product [Staurois parvus]|uniref:Galectin n=1 Tax=Staurois parvus TaxID=386267 RepID=A0ABN9D4Q6_9NEOB|nr:unnamed protein product [Staurois parvus]
MADNNFFLYTFGLKAGQCVEVDGYILEGCKRFFINLGRDSKNLVVQFNARFDYHGEQYVLVLNSLEDNVWGMEQRDRISPSRRGQTPWFASSLS